MNITDIRVKPIDKEDSKMKAVASITIDDEFVVHDIKLIEKDDGYFIAMPSRKDNKGEYRDVAHPLNTSVRTVIHDAILEKYVEICNTPAE